MQCKAWWMSLIFDSQSFWHEEPDHGLQFLCTDRSVLFSTDLGDLTSSGSNPMHEDEHTKIILEKRYSRKITGCMLFVLPVAWLVTGLVGPPAYLVGGVFYGLLFLVLLGKYIFKDLSDSENIVITPVGVHLGEALVQSKSIGAIWASCTQRHILPVIAVQADMVK